MNGILCIFLYFLRSFKTVAEGQHEKYPPRESSVNLDLFLKGAQIFKETRTNIIIVTHACLHHSLWSFLFKIPLLMMYHEGRRDI